MRTTENVESRIQARDRAMSLINQLTAGIVVAGVGALGVFGLVGAVTTPGSSTSTIAVAGGSTGTSTGSASSTSSSSSSGAQSSSGSLSSTSGGSGVVVSGGS